MRTSRLLLLLALLLPGVARAQEAPPKREFRAVWVAAVSNLDWPSNPNLTTAEQQQHLRTMFDRFKALGMNAVIFHVRPEADALYDSPYEPWSRYLTGKQGRAPEPYYDPLTFAVEEAHKRGLELHAWLNPYRAVANVSSNHYIDDKHPTKAHPDWILDFPRDNIKILDPGEPAVREYIFDIVEDIVTRYDVDGIHFDDYFYPYGGTSNEDRATYEKYGRAMFNNISTWRRYNINMFVRGVWERVQAVKPEVKVGISPFGIWKSGTPPGISGLSAYDQIYADAVNWMEQKWLDYLTPQLYWAFGGGQDFAKLSTWWLEKVGERHLYPGLGLYKADPNTFTGATFRADEIPRQVRYLREIDAQGSVFFRARNFQYNSKGISDSLRTDLYRYPALPPVMAWKETVPPNAPQNVTAVADGMDITLTWEAPAEAADGDTARWYAVYRFGAPPALPADLEDASALVAVMGSAETTFVDTPGGEAATYHYVVTALDQNWNESAPSTPAEATDTAEDVMLPTGITLDAPQPNPFSQETQLFFTLSEAGAVTVRVYNLMGQEVATLLDAAQRPAGTHRVTWNPDTLASGTYFVTLEAQGERVSRLVTHL